MSTNEKKYTKDDLTVIWSKDKCIHSGICVKGLGIVFDPNQRPWIDVNKASANEIMKQIDQCPSGALSYQQSDQSMPDLNKDADVQVEVIPDGPLALKSACTVTLANGEKVMQTKASYFCRCGHSENKPFCDGAHKRNEFKG